MRVSKDASKNSLIRIILVNDTSSEVSWNSKLYFLKRRAKSIKQLPFSFGSLADKDKPIFDNQKMFKMKEFHILAIDGGGSKGLMEALS